MGGQEPFDTRLALGVGGDADVLVARKRKRPMQFHILLPSHTAEEPGRSWREDQGPGRLMLRGDAGDKKYRRRWHWNKEETAPYRGAADTSR